MNMIRINAALNILDIWYKSWEDYKNDKTAMGRQAAIRWRAIGIVGHDRILNGLDPSATQFNQIR